MDNNILPILAQIKLIPFRRQHLSMLHEMLKAQDYNPEGVTAKSLPKIGYIAMLGEEPVAAGFLRRVECDIVAQIDGLASNPGFGSVIRHEAINLIISQLVIEAKSLKLQGLIAFTQDCTVIKRAEATGFVKLSHNLLSLTF